MTAVLDADPIAPISDVDDEDGEGPSDLFRATISSQLSQYEDSSVGVDEYYLGRDLDYLSGPIVAAGLVDEDAVWAGTSRGVIRSWSPDGVVERDLKLGSGAAPISAVAFAVDLWAVGDVTGRLQIANQFAEVRSDLPDCHTDHISYMTAAASSLFTCSWDGAVNVVDLALAEITHHYQPCRCPIEFVLALSPTQCWSAGADGRARLLDLRAKDCVQVVRSDVGSGTTPIRCLAMVGPAQQAVLYMGHGQGQVSAMDCRTGRAVRQYFGHSDVVNRILVRNDRLITAGDDVQIRIFDVAHSVSIDKLGGHRHAITNLIVAGTLLVACDAEGAVRRYDLETVQRFHIRRVVEREQQKKALETLAAETTAAKAAAKPKKGKKGKKGKKK